MELMDDNELVELVCKGDQDAFIELFERYQKKLFNLLAKLTKNEDDAMDLLQETFLRVFKNARGFRGKAPFKIWLYTIATNLARTFLKRRKQRMNLYRKLGDEERSPSSNNMASRVKEALDMLPYDQREVIILKEFHRMKFEEIAMVLDLPTATVKSRMRYGILKLAQILKEE